MVRRNYKITDAQDAHISQLSKEIKIDKEEIVQMALELGLPEVEQLWKVSGSSARLDLIRAQLMGSHKGSIKTGSAKRR